MFGKSLIRWLPLTFVVACAEPKYGTLKNTPERGKDNQEQSEQKVNICGAKMNSSGLCVSLIWETLPTEETPGSFLFKTFRANAGDGSPLVEDLKGGALAALLWMPSMGHGSSPITLERLDIGTYRASQVFFIMRGDWEIRIQLRDGNEIKDQAALPYSF